MDFHGDAVNGVGSSDFTPTAANAKRKNAARLPKDVAAYESLRDRLAKEFDIVKDQIKPEVRRDALYLKRRKK